jgi:hypothetical protein
VLISFYPFGRIALFISQRPIPRPVAADCWPLPAPLFVFLVVRGRPSACAVSGPWAAGVGARIATPQEADAGAQRDDPHPGAGHGLLRALQGVAVEDDVVTAGADDHGDYGVEQEQEPEHGLGREQRLHGVPFELR